MKKTLAIFFLLMAVTFAFAQTAYSLIGYARLADGETYPEDLGFEFWKEGETQHFYFNYPENDTNAGGSSYYGTSFPGYEGAFQIQLSVILTHAAGDQINVNFIDNTTGQTAYREYIRGGGSVMYVEDLYLEGGSTPTYTISGNIALEGVLLTGINTDPETITIDTTGDWSFTAEEGADVTITPEKEGYTFIPAQFVATGIAQDYTDFEFNYAELAPDAPINPYPVNGTNGVAIDLPYIWWEAPTGGEVAPTSYYVTLSANEDYSAPIIDNEETMDLMYAIPGGALAEGTMYYAMVTPHYAPPARAAVNMKKEVNLRNISKTSKVRDFGTALAWAFQTYTEGGNTSQNGGNCNGTDPVVIDLPGIQVVIDPAAGVSAVVIVDYTTEPAILTGFGAPELALPGSTFLFGFNIDAGDPSNLNGVIQLNVGPGLNITNLYYHNDGVVWQEFTDPPTWSYDDLTGVITINGMGLSTRGGGDIEIAAHDITLPVEFQSFHATFDQVNGNVFLTWTTASESDMLGYNVLRSDSDDINTAIPVNDGVIAAENQSMTTTYTASDDEVEIGSYYYWIQAIENGGMTFFHGPVSVTVEEQTPDMPAFTTLKNAYPNPFNPKTTIAFDVAEGETAKLTIYNVLGQVVKTFPTFETGRHQQEWTGIDSNNNNVGSGIYFYRLESDSYKKINKMLLLK